jgi:hypothetical protein
MGFEKQPNPKHCQLHLSTFAWFLFYLVVGYYKTLEIFLACSWQNMWKRRKIRVWKLPRKLSVLKTKNPANTFFEFSKFRSNFWHFMLKFSIFNLLSNDVTLISQKFKISIKIAKFSNLSNFFPFSILNIFLVKFF